MKPGMKPGMKPAMYTVMKPVMKPVHSHVPQLHMLASQCHAYWQLVRPGAPDAQHTPAMATCLPAYLPTYPPMHVSDAVMPGTISNANSRP